VIVFHIFNCFLKGKTFLVGMSLSLEHSIPTNEKRMNYKLSFRELAALQKEVLSRQSPTTLEKARQQVKMLKKKSSSKSKKQRL
jgi:hypothetical protein